MHERSSEPAGTDKCSIFLIPEVSDSQRQYLGCMHETNDLRNSIKLKLPSYSKFRFQNGRLEQKAARCEVCLVEILM